MSEKRRTGVPWMTRLDPAQEERAMRTAKAFGLAENGDIAKSRLLRLGLDFACKAGIRRQLAAAGGLVVAARSDVRGLRQVLLDAVAVTAGAEAALLELLGVTSAELAEVFEQYPNVAKAYAIELAKRTEPAL